MQILPFAQDNRLIFSQNAQFFVKIYGNVTIAHIRM